MTTHALREVLDQGGVRAMLTAINEHMPHRFAALFLIDDPWLKQRYFVDALAPDQEEPGEPIPITASYCAFVRSERETFTMEDALFDQRVATHPKRFTIRSYCGVPLTDKWDKVYGTICVFDTEPHPVPTPMVEMMEAVAPILARYLSEASPAIL